MTGRETETDRRRVCVAVIAGAHGVRGAVRLKSFTEDPATIAEHSDLRDEAGEPVSLTIIEVRPRRLVARIAGVDDRAAAEALRGRRLYVPREALPQTDDEEYYHADLIGLACVRGDGTPLGVVKSVHDFGAGDVVEIAGPDGSLLVPFTKAAVPLVDISGGKLVIEPPSLLEEAE